MSEAPVNPTAIVPGWFGKLPSLGDFASRRFRYIPTNAVATTSEALCLPANFRRR